MSSAHCCLLLPRLVLSFLTSLKLARDSLTKSFIRHAPSRALHHGHVFQDYPCRLNLQAPAECLLERSAGLHLRTRLHALPYLSKPAKSIETVCLPVKMCLSMILDGTTAALGRRLHHDKVGSKVDLQAQCDVRCPSGDPLLMGC